ncbi:hypothetical protein SNOG_14262 [Parastagonospora nodorum SN15]|nr:hypothetical protein SNOG_14262 [Parastagonospora nodorum SN15]EAT78499.2 hypothetical protein SNOG_14262 [Parastagonospora nodorum SN15]
MDEREVKKVDSGYLGKDEDKSPAGDESKKSTTPKGIIKAIKLETLPNQHQKATPEQILEYLLSDAALQYCRPDDEARDIESHRADMITYSSQLLSPFEELLCAVVLSRPISHRLGLRTIRTILNKPYSLRDPLAIKTAGPKKVLKALEAACTQHKDKTADEISLLAEAVSNNDWHNDLSKLRAQSKNGVESEREVLRRSVKGLGKTGLDIFYRRVQWQWDEAFPFVDARTQAALGRMGLPKRAEEIEKLIESRWTDLNSGEGDGHDLETRKRRVFVVLLERAIGADLEKKIDQVLNEASKL